MTPRSPLILLIAAACAPGTASMRPSPDRTYTDAELTAVACARSQALALGYRQSTTNNGYAKSYDDGGRDGHDLLSFGIKDHKLVVTVVGSPSHTPASGEALLAKNEIERRCAT